MTDHEARDLRRELAARDRGRGKRYPASLRVRVGAWLQRHVGNGTTLRAAADAIALDPETARRWLRASPPPVTALVPVEVIAATDTRQSVSLVSPSGYRIEGLTLDEAASLLRRIG
jgi:hypothetical protein